MLGGLFIFLLICGGAAAFTRWLLFESPTQLSVTLQVGQGTVGLAKLDNMSDEKAERTTAQIGHNDRLSTDNNSQGFLTFADPYSGEVLASITIRNNSAITLESATRPRFNMSENSYAIRLTGAAGRLEVRVNANLDRELRLDIESPLGLTRISASGNYLIESNPAYLQVMARSGSAILIDQSGFAQHIAASAQATIYQGNNEITVSDAPVELLPNSTFEMSPNSTIESVNNADWPYRWSCYTESDDPEKHNRQGTFQFPLVDGRRAIHIERLEIDPGPGRTGCKQVLAGRDGLNVLQYDDLRLRVTMQVNYQKLSACGAAGSECPVMLHIRYKDRDGNNLEWYHGFYAEYEPNVGRTICDSCLIPHDWINKNAWFTYESGNLFTDLPVERRPGSIVEVEFYASGHEYDVMLNEVSLIAYQSIPVESAAATP